VQSEVASAIATQLQPTLSGDENKALAAPLTTNAQAHDAWLRAVVFFNRGGEDPQGDELAIQQLSEATRLDPGFAAAWALLSRAHGSQYFQQYDHSEARKAQAKAALDHAVQLAPDTTETRTAAGYYQYWVERDFPAAIRTFSAIEAKEPNNVDALPALAYIARRQGRNDEAVRRLAQAIELDPRNIQLLTEAAWTYTQGRDYDGARRVVDRALNVKPDDGNLIATKAVTYQKMGRLDEAAPLIEALRPDGTLPQVVFAIESQADLTRQFAPSAARLQTMLDQIAAAPAGRVGPVTRGGYEMIVGALQLSAGQADAAHRNLESARDRLEAELRNEPGNFIGLMYLSRAFSELGDRDAAMKTIDRAIEQTPTSSDALYGPLLEDKRARIQARFGEIDAPIAALTRLLKLRYANNVTVASMRLDPDWDSLRKDPRFVALLDSDGAGAARP
jgi:tetratricopeptide (TPR) repeat protein